MRAKIHEGHSNYVQLYRTGNNYYVIKKTYYISVNNTIAGCYLTEKSVIIAIVAVLFDIILIIILHLIIISGTPRRVWTQA